MRDATELATKILRGWVKSGRVACNCGGPQLGTAHAPDCRIEIEWGAAMDEARDEISEAEAAKACPCGHGPHAGQCGHPDGCWCDTFTPE